MTAKRKIVTSVHRHNWTQRHEQGKEGRDFNRKMEGLSVFPRSDITGEIGCWSLQRVPNYCLKRKKQNRWLSIYICARPWGLLLTVTQIASGKTQSMSTTTCHHPHTVPHPSLRQESVCKQKPQRLQESWHTPSTDVPALRNTLHFSCCSCCDKIPSQRQLKGERAHSLRHSSLWWGSQGSRGLNQMVPWHPVKKQRTMHAC